MNPDPGAVSATVPRPNPCRCGSSGHQLDSRLKRRYSMGMNDIAKQLRQAARKAGVTQYRISKNSGLWIAAVQGWWKGGDLLCTSAVKIAQALGYQIVLKPIKKAR